MVRTFDSLEPVQEPRIGVRVERAERDFVASLAWLMQMGGDALVLVFFVHLLVHMMERSLRERDQNRGTDGETQSRTHSPPEYATLWRQLRRQEDEGSWFSRSVWSG